MDMNLTQLCDLDPMIDDSKILARCISIWKSHPLGNPNQVWSLDAVLQDQQGNRVQATIKGKHISKFQLLLDEGACYRIGNFGVGDNSGKYPLLNHRFKLNFFQGTTVTRVGSFDNNPRGFKFEHFSSFTARTFTETELCDVIGTVVSVSDAIPFNNYGKDQLRRTIILEDVHGAQLECCFFYAWCNKFTKLYDERESMGHVVMILQLCKVKYFNAKTSVSPAMYSTKLYLNDDIQEIAAFRQRYSEKEGFDPANHTIAVYTPVKKEITADDFFKGAIKKTVGSIRDSDGPYHCLLYAKIHKIHRENGWTYLACKKCGRSAGYIRVKLLSVDEAMVTRFKKDFILQDGVGDLQAPLLDTAKSSRFSNVANIPFNLEDSPQTADGTTEGNGTNTNGEGCSKETENDGGDSGSGKRTIIDLDDYYEKPAVAKRNKVIQVKLEPKD
ncbi:replication protein A 70 kDa DNA-binding subunit B [Tanacetum coccineum]